MLKVGLTETSVVVRVLVAKDIFPFLEYRYTMLIRNPGSSLEISSSKRKFSAYSEKIFYHNRRNWPARIGNHRFSDERALRRLDSILHPMVIDDFMHWCETFREHPYIIHEAAIIFESGVAGISTVSFTYPVLKKLPSNVSWKEMGSMPFQY